MRSVSLVLCLSLFPSPLTPRRSSGRVCGVATVKTRPTHPSCRDSVGLLAPRYMDGFGQVALLLVCGAARAILLDPLPPPPPHSCSA